MSAARSVVAAAQLITVTAVAVTPLRGSPCRVHSFRWAVARSSAVVRALATARVSRSVPCGQGDARASSHTAAMANCWHNNTAMDQSLAQPARRPYCHTGPLGPGPREGLFPLEIVLTKVGPSTRRPRTGCARPRRLVSTRAGLPPRRKTKGRRVWSRTSGERKQPHAKPRPSLGVTERAFKAALSGLPLAVFGLEFIG